MFGFQKLQVYKASIEFLALAIPIAESMPKGHSALGEQFRRAAVSIPLNLAEGSGKFDRDAKRFYAISRGSALECAAILDVVEVLKLIGGDRLEDLRHRLDRIVAMQTGLLRQ